MSNPMYGAEMEAELARVERDPATAPMAARLRTMRDEIARRSGDSPAAYARTLELQCRADGIPQPIKARLLLGLDMGRLPIMRLEGALQGDRRVICLVGKSGAGKTIAACWWLSQRTGRFVLASHLACLNAHMREDRGELYEHQRSPALVIDDLARGSETDADRARIGDFLSQRADNGLWTVCTTLKMPAYGESLIRRMTISVC